MSSIRSLSFDNIKQTRLLFKDNRPKLKASSAAESEFYRSLKKVAKHSSSIVDIHTDGAIIHDIDRMLKDLLDYSNLLEPWAKRQSEKLIASVSATNKRELKRRSKTIGKQMNETRETNVYTTATQLMTEQVSLIKSIPVDLGLRAQEIARENILNGQRAIPDPEIVSRLKDEMGMTEEVAINRAKLIARTETARANASIVQARAQDLGVEAYIWRTSEDAAVRPSHKKMNGKVIRYDSPPTLEDGTTGHSGTFFNCRCYQIPLLPD